MIMEVVKYGHPALRQKGLRVEKITPEILKLIADMFETMYAANGVALPLIQQAASGSRDRKRVDFARPGQPKITRKLMYPSAKASR